MADILEKLSLIFMAADLTLLFLGLVCGVISFVITALE